MTAQIPFNGIMDLDSPNEVIQPGFHKNARNVEFEGIGVKRAKNKKGTRKKVYTLPEGYNETIGSYYDANKQATFWFNKNSNGKHGIYRMKDDVIQAITVCDDVDYLNFTSYPIHSINILVTDYGDILKFIDSQKRPSQINIDRALAGGYGTMQRSYLDVAKEPPSVEPLVAYANDLAATVNNLTKSLFQFAYSFVFDDREESVLSAFSEMPIAPNSLDVNLPITTNARITAVLQTGNANVKKINLYVRRNVESTYGDWYRIETLDKLALSIGDNTTYTYDFKNNSTGVAADVKYATLLFDYVPREANSQEVVNGNIMVYGGVKEGYNIDHTTNVTLTVDTTSIALNPYTVVPIYNFWSKYRFGLVYFDEKGRTNGVLSSPSFDASTEFTSISSGGIFTLTIPRINAQINHRPPSWARYYQWVRTKNLLISKFIFWISESTYKDDKFAYIGIQNLYTKAVGDKAESIITYDFTPGDRVRIITLDSSSADIGKDFQIEALVNSPEIGYVQRSGFFLKIKLPTTAPGFDFGAAGYGSYRIEIYTPASITSDKLNVYYEFGELYGIGNAGTVEAYHRGATQDQSADLVTPATFSFTKGDVYLRQRAINYGSGVEFKTDSGDAWTSFLVIGAKIKSLTISNDTYEAGQTDFIEAQSLDYNGSDNHWLIRTHGTAYTFRIKGVLKISSTSNIAYKVFAALATVGGSGNTDIDVIPTMQLAAGDNEIPFDVTITVPIETKLYLITDNSNSQSLHYYSTTFSITTSNAAIRILPDANFSDSYLSAVNSNGRPFVIDDGSAEYNKDIIRFSEDYQTGTEINRTNRFFPLNYVACDSSKGSIQRLKVRGDILKAIQYRGVKPFGINRTMLTTADGSNSLIQSEKLLNEFKYYDGDYGIGNQPCSLASSSSADYFIDPIRGYHVRLAGDGMTPISELYKAQFYLPPIAAQYLQGHIRGTDTSAASKILGVYDFLNEEAITIFQECRTFNLPHDLVYAGDALAFNEPRNGYTSFYDYYVESMVCAENTLISWKGGEIFIHDSQTRNTFHGTYYPSKIDVVVNQDPNVKKEFIAIGFHSNKSWLCPSVITATDQLSNLIESDFDFREGMFAAAFLRDINSIGSLNDGDFLKGVWAQVQLKNTSTALAYLTGLYINYLISTKNF